MDFGLVATNPDVTAWFRENERRMAEYAAAEEAKRLAAEAKKKQDAETVERLLVDAVAGSDFG